MKNVYFYVDGLNLYHALDSLGNHSLKWLNLVILASSYLRFDEKIAGISYFTAIQCWNEEKKQRQEDYLDALGGVGINVNVAKFKKAKKYCKKFERYCKFDEEKQSDVGISVAMISSAYSQAVSRMVLVTADTDQIPTVQHIRSNFPHIEMTLALPPGRKNEARDLGALFDAPEEITVGRLGACLFPPSVIGASGRVIRRPEKYAPQPTAMPASPLAATARMR